MKQIKVLHVQLTENIGGIESLLMSVTNQIDKKKYHFDFIASASSSYQTVLKQEGCNVIVLPSFKNLVKYISRFNKVLDNDYDIVHFHKNSAINILPILIAKFHKTHPKIVVHSHNTAPSVTKNKLFIQIHKMNRKFMYDVADIHIACSSKAAKWLYGNRKAIILKNGIDTEKYVYSKIRRNRIRKYLNISSNSLVIGNVGRLTAQKNQLFLVELFSKIHQIKPNSKLLIIGDGLLKSKILNKIEELKLKKSVMLLGSRNHVEEYLSAMDVFVMPSLYEGLPIAAVEAQVSGLNVYMSDKITKEVCLTNHAYTFALNEPIDKITKEILSSDFDYDRLQQSKMVKKSGYDISSTVNKLDEIYTQLIKSNN